MDAKTVYPAKANFALATKKTWDHWHRKFGHISQKSLENLAKNRIVEGFAIDQLSMPSITCEACIQAKQSWKPYPKEAKNRLKNFWGKDYVGCMGTYEN